MMGFDPDSLRIVCEALMLVVLSLLAGAGVLGVKLDEPRLFRLAAVALGIYGIALVGDALATTAVLTEAPLADLPGLAGTVITKSIVGHLIAVSAVGWFLLLAAFLTRRRWTDHRVFLRLSLSGFLLLAYGRAANGHASEDGLFGTPVFIHLLHVLAGTLWAGSLMVYSQLPVGAIQGRESDLAKHLSEVATTALMTIVFTGLGDAIRMAEGVTGFWHTAYAQALAIKLAVVTLAVGMGGWNRLNVLSRVENGGGDAAVSFRRIVRLESLVLLAILILAARLGALSPLE